MDTGLQSYSDEQEIIIDEEVKPSKKMTITYNNSSAPKSTYEEAQFDFDSMFLILKKPKKNNPRYNDTLSKGNMELSLEEQSMQSFRVNEQRNLIEQPEPKRNSRQSHKTSFKKKSNQQKKIDNYLPKKQKIEKDTKKDFQRLLPDSLFANDDQQMKYFDEKIEGIPLELQSNEENNIPSKVEQQKLKNDQNSDQDEEIFKAEVSRIENNLSNSMAGATYYGKSLFSEEQESNFEQFKAKKLEQMSKQTFKKLYIHLKYENCAAITLKQIQTPIKTRQRHLKTFKRNDYLEITNAIFHTNRESSNHDEWFIGDGKDKIIPTIVRLKCFSCMTKNLAMVKVDDTATTICENCHAPISVQLKVVLG